MRFLPVLCVLTAVAVSTSACTATPDAVGPGLLAAGAYRTFESCDQIVDFVAANADAVGGWGFDMPTAERATDAAAPSAGAVPSSSTNTQVTGVDEGDLVDHDGRRLFSAVDGRLVVVDLATGAVLDDVPLPAGQHHLVLAGPSLLVVSEQYDPVPSVVVARYAVTAPDDAANPPLSLVDRVLLEGSLAAVRAADGVARVVLTHRFADSYWWSPRYDAESVEPDWTIEDIVPQIAAYPVDSVPGPAAAAIDCTDVGTPSTFSGLSTTWVASVDLVDLTDDVTADTAIIADASAVYADTEQLLVATQVFDESTDSTLPVLRTTVHRFAAEADRRLAYTGSGSVPGRVVNRFALSGTDAHVFVATTVDASGFATVKASRVTVLAGDGELEEVAVVDGLGIDEDIQSVRFADSRAYVVTFRTVDPLYVVDLADPDNPVLTGELKIPGFSSYLHPLGPDLVAGIGFDADPDTGRVTGAQLSLFSVPAVGDPVRIDTEPLGDHSGAAYDPHALAYVPDAGWLAIPFSEFHRAPDDCLSMVPEMGVDSSGADVAPPRPCPVTGPVEGVRIFELADTGITLLAELAAAGPRVVFAAGVVAVIGYDGIVAFDASSFEERYRIDRA